MEITSFITNVGLITSKGSFGDNVMACEWTHQVSESPTQIMICIKPDGATYANIQEHGQFGVNICSIDQNVIASIAGNNSGKDIDKVDFLKEFGVSFYKAKTIDVLMVTGSSLNAECVLTKLIEISDYSLFIGTVQFAGETRKEPLSYHMGKYFRLGKQISKPDNTVLDRIELLKVKYSRSIE